MSLVKNKLGYTEINPKPTPDELRAYYNDKYFGGEEGGNQYSYEYTVDELQHKKIAVEEAAHFFPSEGKTLFEIGIGEGFFLNGFKEKGWSVSGADFTRDGVLRYHPELEEKIIFGDVFDVIDQVAKEGKKFDAVACNNVLEHVIDPLGLLDKIKALLKPGGVCRLVVPNDGSWLQDEVVRREHAPADFWVCPPDHLNYFNIDSLKKTLEFKGFKLIEVLADFPIDLFLLNPDSNFKMDPPRGRNCHFSRVMFELRLYQESLEKLISFRRGCAEAGIGRDIAVYFQGGEK